MYIGVTNYPDFLKTQSVQTTIAGQTSLTGLNYDPGNVEVYKNGLRLLPSQYAAPDGMNITLYVAAALLDTFDIVSREENAVGSDVVSVNGKTGVVVLDHYDFPDMPWLDGSGRIPSSLLPTSVVGAVVYQGTWNASSGSAPSASPTKGQYWVVSIAGTTDLSGINQWYIGDTAIYNGTTWDRLDGSANEVLSVNGRTGNVVITSTDVETALSWRPVQEGGGLRQVTGHKVNIGWGFDGLTATVDTTDVGTFVFSNPGNEYINYGRLPHTLLLSDNKGLISVGTDLPAYGAQFLRLRAEPSLWGSPYGELIIGSNGQNKFSGYTNLSGGAETVTPAFGDSSAKVATTAFVQTALGGFTGLDGKVDVAGDTMTGPLAIWGNGTGNGDATLYATYSSPVNWTGFNNVVGATNGQYASFLCLPGQTTDALQVDHSGFAIPVAATITGITVRVVNYIHNNTLDGTGVIQLKGSSFPSGSLEKNFTANTSAGITAIGGPGDLWALTLTPAIVNDPNFGVFLYFTTELSDGGSPIFEVDSIEIVVHYSDIGVTGGQLFLGNSGTRHLSYNGSNYLLANAPLTVGGTITAPGAVINGSNVLTQAGGAINGVFTKTLYAENATTKSAPNATGTKYISTSAPSGGVDGDIWYQY